MRLLLPVRAPAAASSPRSAAPTRGGGAWVRNAALQPARPPALDGCAHRAKHGMSGGGVVGTVLGRRAGTRHVASAAEADADVVVSEPDSDGEQEDIEVAAGGLAGGEAEATNASKKKGPTGPSPKTVRREVARRRNFAIISHPDAGKTTLTEKLLLYGGAIHEAGAVKARGAARHATSDWMEIEKQRGISITSTAMQFEYQGTQLNLLDTPGHQDFSEDTYRTLAAADNALMLIDAAKGLEPQTRKLFEVCRMRDLPIFTFVNKMDRPALNGLELLDQIEQEFNLPTFAVNWPVGSGDRFVGVLDRMTGDLHLYTKTGAEGRAKGAQTQIIKWDDPAVEELVEPDLLAEVREEVEMLDELAGRELDVEAVLAGELSPVFFGSAMNNFGVELFLNSFMQTAEAPGAHVAANGEVVESTDTRFTGIVFKLQANMDPKHRDKVAFVRVRSGHFEKGMKVKVARTGKTVTLSRPQKMFAQDRETVEEGYAGDVIGLNNPDAFAIGDTIYANGQMIEYPGIPMFSPELFAVLRLTDPSKRKQFHKGLDSLLGEGAVQVLYSTDDFKQDPIMAAVGQLQLEVVKSRMQTEYNCDVEVEPLPYTVARWVEGGWDALEDAGRIFNATTVKDRWGRPVLLFRNAWNVTTLESDSPELGTLLPYSMPPSSA